MTDYSQEQLDAAIASVVPGGQTSDQCHVERVDLLEDGRRAKMLRVWEVYDLTGQNITQTAKRCGCTRNTVKLYLRLYRQELKSQ